MLVLKISEPEKPCPATLDEMQKKAIESLQDSSKKMKDRITEVTLRLSSCTQVNAG